jgi:hypothetical protein
MGVRAICEQGYPVTRCRCMSRHDPVKVVPCPPEHLHEMRYDRAPEALAAYAKHQLDVMAPDHTALQSPWKEAFEQLTPEQREHLLTGQWAATVEEAAGLDTLTEADMPPIREGVPEVGQHIYLVCPRGHFQLCPEWGTGLSVPPCCRVCFADFTTWRPICDDPIECGHEAALGELEEKIRRLLAAWDAPKTADAFGETTAAVEALRSAVKP